MHGIGRSDGVRPTCRSPRQHSPRPRRCHPKRMMARCRSGSCLGTLLFGDVLSEPGAQRRGGSAVGTNGLAFYPSARSSPSPVVIALAGAVGGVVGLCGGGGGGGGGGGFSPSYSRWHKPASAQQHGLGLLPADAIPSVRRALARKMILWPMLRKSRRRVAGEGIEELNCCGGEDYSAAVGDIDGGRVPRIHRIGEPCRPSAPAGTGDSSTGRASASRAIAWFAACDHLEVIDRPEVGSQRSLIRRPRMARWGRS